MAQLYTKNPNQTRWMLSRLPGPVFCGPENFPDTKDTKQVLPNCPDKNFCLMRGTNLISELCIYGEPEAGNLTQFVAPDLNKKPKVVNRVRIRLPQGRAKGPRLLGVNVVASDPAFTIQMLGEVGGAHCGSRVVPVKLEDCPMGRFCRFPGGHEMCIYGPNEF